jgi:hypothetical protein
MPEKAEDMKEEETTEDTEWTSIEQLLEEANAIHFIEPEYRGKKVRLAWKEIPEGKELDLDMSRSFEDMTPKERMKFQSNLLEAEALARIEEAGRQEGCLNDNMMDKDTWGKFPQRLKTVIISDILELNKILERRF